LGFGGLLLALIALAVHLRKPQLMREAKGGWQTWAAILIGGASVMAYQATFFAGTRANGVAIGTVIAIGSSPLFAGLFEWLILRLKPDLIWFGLTLLGIGGVYLLSVLGSAEVMAESADLGGVAASLGAGASYASYVVAMRVVLARGWSSLAAVASMLGFGSLLAFGTLATTDASWLGSTHGLLVVAWLAIVTVVASYILNSAGLAGVNAATAATLTLAEPATAATLGVLVLHEALTGYGVLGIALVVLSVVLIGLPRRKADVKTS
jgi:DME family drug/metabolite transporter